MSRTRKQSNYTSIWDSKELLKILNPRHASVVWNYLIQNPEITQISEIPLNKWSIRDEVKHLIEEKYVYTTSKIVEVFESSRGDTIKLLIELFDGNRIETVIMKHHKRTTVCLSSQVGCQMGCKFCATGTMGIICDLYSNEIIEQLVFANQFSDIRNVVFMGMGEPLNNYDNVKNSIEFMIDSKHFSLSSRHVTVSTVGVIKNMYRLSQDFPKVNLAVSLHAPNQTLRRKVIPTAGGNPLEQIMEAITSHIIKNCQKQTKSNDEMNHKISEIQVENNTLSEEKNIREDDESTALMQMRKHLGHQGVMIEYILLAGLNDLPEIAHELGALLLPIRDSILLNLIPYNSTDVKADFKPPTKESVESFQKICMSSPYYIHTRIRQEMGQDIAGACGQLVIKKTGPSKSIEENKSRELEDLVQPISSKRKKRNVLNNKKSKRPSLGYSPTCDNPKQDMKRDSVDQSYENPMKQTASKSNLISKLLMLLTDTTGSIHSNTVITAVTSVAVLSVVSLTLIKFSRK